MLAYEEAGEGPVLVLLHGIATSRVRWRPLVELLAADFRCLSVDLPGHGESPDEGLDSVSAALAVQELVRSLSLASPVVVGHSLGANVALLHGALFGGPSVVAVDPAPLHLPHFADRVAPFAEVLRGPGFADGFRQWESGFAGAVQDSDLWEVIEPRQHVVLSYWAKLLRREDAVELQPRWEQALTSLAVPALVCLPHPASPEDAAILARMPTTTVEVFEGLSHALHLADPQRFADRLRRWVR